MLSAAFSSLFCLLVLPLYVSSFVSIGYHSKSHRHYTTQHYISAQDLLYQDQQEAMLRRAIHEQDLLNRKNRKELKAHGIKKTAPKSGTGFASKVDPKALVAEQHTKIVHRDGVVRINNVLSETAADKFREHVLEEQRFAAAETQENPRLSRAYYGVENARKNRCDLQLSLLRGGYAATATNGAETDSHPLADVLLEILGPDGTLRPLYENLVTPNGELYELATVITEPGSNQQTVHADLPFQPDAPLYVIFLALQDVDASMGPTSFLLKTHTAQADEMFNGSLEQKDQQLLNADCRLATLKKGDCVLFDARVLHCGNSNDSKDQTRALFNFSFRNPVVKGNLGYDGSIMPGYVGALSLADLETALKAYKEDGVEDPFAKYGNGLE